MSEEEACKFESTGEKNENQSSVLIANILTANFLIRHDVTKKFLIIDTESNESCQTDYSEKRAIPISIPTLHVKNKNGDRYIVSFISKFSQLN